MHPRIINRWIFWFLWLPGAAMVAFGIYDLIANAERTHPSSSMSWFVGGLIVHDFLVAPLVFALGILLRKRIPARWRPAVQGGLILSALVLLFSIPAIGAWGRRATNPTILPGDYPRAVVLLLVSILSVAGVLIVGTWSRGRSRERHRGLQER